MSETDNVRALVEYRMEQADEALHATTVNLAAGLARPAANRANYAMFYAVLALLATEKKETSRHSGAISLFDRLVVKTTALPRDLHVGCKRPSSAPRSWTPGLGRVFRKSGENVPRLSRSG